jgi:hypothetical protein
MNQQRERKRMKGGRKGKKRHGGTQRTYLAFTRNRKSEKSGYVGGSYKSKSVHEPY